MNTSKDEKELETSSSDDFSKRGTEEARNDPRTNEELINSALHLISEGGEDKAWEPISTLQFRATREVFEVALRLCESEDPLQRRLGADVLGQLGIPDRVFPDESVELLLKWLEVEENPDVLNSIAVALGHIHDSKAVEPLSKLKDHPHEDVRLGVVHGLRWHRDPLAIGTLIELSADVDEDVRDWATFGLGNLMVGATPDEDYEEYTDTPEIREALAARLDDPHEDTRYEGIMGLALRKDKRAVEPLRKGMEQDDWDSVYVCEAAAMLADPTLLPALLKLRREGETDEVLEAAIESCEKGIPIDWQDRPEL